MLLYIYCDESRQNKDQYMVFSGIIITSSNVVNFQSEIQAFRKRTNMYGEFKWTKVSKAKLNEYKELIEIFF